MHTFIVFKRKRKKEKKANKQVFAPPNLVLWYTANHFRKTPTTLKLKVKYERNVIFVFPYICHSGLYASGKIKLALFSW